MKSDENPTVDNAYDKLAQTYKENENDPYCADLEFPAMINLILNVEGKQVLDAGCGYGRYAEWLIERGPDVIAVDKNANMLEQAKHRIGDRAELHRADITQPFDFFDEGICGGIMALATYCHHRRARFAARIRRP